MTKVLVVSAHPDDESLGCGGALSVHASAGDDIDAVFLTSGEQGGHGLAPDETAVVREREGRSACDVLGVRRTEFWREPDGALTHSVAVTGRLTEVMQDRRPQLIYVPHPEDDHPDHQAAAAIAMTALRDSGIDAALLFTEIWTPLSRFTDVVDISDHIDTKLRAVRQHVTQCAVMEFPEAVRCLNRYRGVMHLWPGGPYAEVFARWSP